MQIPTLKIALASGIDAKINIKPAEGTAVKIGKALIPTAGGHTSCDVAFGLGTYTLIQNHQHRELYTYRNKHQAKGTFMTFIIPEASKPECMLMDETVAFIISIIRIAPKPGSITAVNVIASAQPNITKGYCTLEPSTRLLVFLDNKVQLVKAENLFSRDDITIKNLTEAISTIILDYIEDLDKLSFEYGLGFRYDCTDIAELQMGTSPDISITEYYNCDAIASLKQREYPNSTRRIDLSSAPLTRVPAYIFMNSSIEDIKLPRTLKSLHSLTFLGCKALKYIELPDELEYLEIGAFQNSGLQLLVIPESVKQINLSRFAIPDLHTLVIQGTDISWFYDASIMNPDNNVTFISCQVGDLLNLSAIVNGLLDLFPKLRYINNKPISYYQTEEYKANLLLCGYKQFVWHSQA